MIPNDFIAQLLSRVDVVEIIDRHVPLKKAGQNYSACCPFHKEKSPSFSVSQSKQFYHCFGCGAHGSAITFLMEYAGKSFPDAVEELAQGIGLTVPNDNTRQADPQAGGLFDVMLVAANFYKQQLKTSPIAIAYFKKRGVSGEVARRFHLGWAPAGWQPLAEAFADYADNQLLETAGLVATGDAGKRYDRFRERVIFPILNQQGAVIGFGGRILGSKDDGKTGAKDGGKTGAKDGAGPKYLNSPETPIFSKGRELYGLFQAQAAIRKMNRVLVVEGYMDVVALAQYGVEYVVATLGTATTEAHTQRLLRAADEVVFSFDGDAAGQRAAWRALENALPALRDGKQVRFLFLPTEHDPDSYVREFGREAFEDYVAKALPLSEYWIRELNTRHPGESAEAKAARASAARLHLELVSAPMMRESLAKVLEGDVDIAAHTLLPPVKVKPVEASPDDDEPGHATARWTPGRRPPMPATTRTDPATQRVLASARRILGRPKLAMYLVDTQFPDPANAPHVLRLLQAVIDVAIRAPDEPNMGALLEQFRETEFAGDVSRLLTHGDAEVDAAVNDEEAESDLRQLRAQIEDGSLFPSTRVVTMPEQMQGVGILALGARRVILPATDHPLPGADGRQAFRASPLKGEGLEPANKTSHGGARSSPLPPGGGGVGERGRTQSERTSVDAAVTLSPNPSPLKGEGGREHRHLRDFARELRVKQTPWEQELWQELRAHRFADVKFKRQQPIGPYIVDFVALSKSLVVELDGSQHSQSAGYDEKRDAFLKKEGFRVMRVWNNQWTENREGVLEAIWAVLTDQHPLPGADGRQTFRAAPLKGEALDSRGFPATVSPRNPAPLKGEALDSSPLPPRGGGAGERGPSEVESDDCNDIPFDFEANFAPSSADSHDAPF